MNQDQELEQEQTPAPAPHRLPMTYHENIVTEEKVEEIAEENLFSLDLSNIPNKGIGAGYELAPTLTELDLTHNQIKVIEKLEPLTQLKTLGLRQNIIEEIGSGFQTLHSLTSLDLYDNRIEVIEGLSTLGSLTNLDLSYNVIRTIDADSLKGLDSLEQLYLTENKIREIKNLEPVGNNLKILELGANRIKKIGDGLKCFKKLEALWLGGNRISTIEGIDTPELSVSLVKLSLQCNKITTVEHGLGTLVNLTELYLSENGLTNLHGVETLVNLRILDVGANFLTDISGVEPLVNLEDFWCNDNKIEKVEEVKKLAGAKGIQTVYFESNPFSTNNKTYVAQIKKFIPSLTQIDGSLFP